MEGVIAAIKIRQKILRKIRQRGALNEQTAISPDELGLNFFERRHLIGLEKKGQILRTNDGRIYVLCTRKQC